MYQNSVKVFLFVDAAGIEVRYLKRVKFTDDWVKISGSKTSIV